MGERMEAKSAATVQAQETSTAQLAELMQMCKLLLDEERWQILGLLARRGYTVDELAQELPVARSSIMRHLAQLGEAMMVETKQANAGTLYQINAKEIRMLKKRFFARPQPPADQTEPERVLSAFVRQDRITHMPVHPEKMRILLEWLAERFTPGERYAEREVNEILTRHHEDYAMLRRYLVDHGLLAREQGIYWRVES